MSLKPSKERQFALTDHPTGSCTIIVRIELENARDGTRHRCVKSNVALVGKRREVLPS